MTTFEIVMTVWMGIYVAAWAFILLQLGIQKGRKEGAWYRVANKVQNAIFTPIGWAFFIAWWLVLVFGPMIFDV